MRREFKLEFANWESVRFPYRGPSSGLRGNAGRKIVNVPRRVEKNIPHCEKCLTQKHSNGSIDYFHTVLEAKLITPQGMTFSIGSVFIENEVGHYDKQDCELKAFYRLAPKLKAAFPRLAICLLMDSLYANEKVLQICENLNWSYFVAFKEGSIPTLYKEAFKVMDQHLEDHVSVVNQDGNEEIYRWACNLNYKSRTAA